MDSGKVAMPRRGFIRAAGLGVVAVGATAATALGQKDNPGRLPADSPITKQGFDAAEIKVMTANAQKLTKGDMLALQKLHAKDPKLNTAQLLDEYNKETKQRITVEDIQSIQKAYAMREERQHAPGVKDVTACCCCCPCCTCTASVVISSRVR